MVCISIRLLSVDVTYFFCLFIAYAKKAIFTMHVKSACLSLCSCMSATCRMLNAYAVVKPVGSSFISIAADCLFIAPCLMLITKWSKINCIVNQSLKKNAQGSIHLAFKVFNNQPESVANGQIKTCFSEFV